MSAHLKAKIIFTAALCIGGLGAAYWYISSLSLYSVYQIETHDTVSGLIVDSPVELHGVEIGKVTRIALADGDTVDILVSVLKTAPITQATVATVTSRGLAARGFTGYVYIALENTGTGSKPPPIAAGRPYAIIPAAPSNSDTLDTTITEASRQVRMLTRLVQSVLDEKTVASLKQSIDGLQQMLHTLVANKERLDSLLVNIDRDSRALGELLDDKTVSSLKRTLDGIQGVLSTLTTNEARLRSLIINGEADSREIRPLLETSSATLKELNGHALPRLYQSLDVLDGLAHSVNGLTDRIARDPSSVVRGTVTRPGPGER